MVVQTAPLSYARRLACIVALSLTTISWAQVSPQPSLDVYVPVQNVGSTDSGTFRTLYGCGDNGASLSTLTLWANEQFIRGMSASLTDGRRTLFGCVNVTATQTGGCNDTNIRSSSFSFRPGELVTNLTLWPGYNVQGQPNQRAGALTIVTSLGRSFDFGMSAPRVNPVSVSLGSGIPCGVAPRAGADVDALGFVFLLPVTSSTLQDIFYFGVSNQQNASLLDTTPLDSNITNVMLSSQTYNNSGKSSALEASFSSEKQVETPASWSVAPGLDSYLTSRVRTTIPEVHANTSVNSTPGWNLGQESFFNRTDNSVATRSWNYTLNVGPGGISQAVAQAVQGMLTTSYTANLTVLLDSGSNFTVPVTGTFEGMSTSPAEVQVTEVQAASAKSSNSSGSNNTLAWVLGVIFGVLGGLIFAALLAWALVLLVRRKNHRSQSTGSDPKAAPDSFYVPGKQAESQSPKGDGKPGKDVELGAVDHAGSGKRKGGVFAFLGNKGQKGENDRKKWAEKPDPKLETVVGVPANEMAGGEHQASSRSGDRFVVPYVMFRRLRLEAIRNALGLDGQEEGQTKEPEARPAEPAAPGLSNPPSGASTPRALPNSAPTTLQPQAAVASNQTAALPSTGSHARPAACSSDEKVLTGNPRVESGELSRQADESSKACEPERYERNFRLKDRVAAVMASRKSKVQQEAAPSTQEKQLSGSQATSKYSESKEGSALSRIAKSVASLPARRSSGSIQHDDHVISLNSWAQKEPRPDEPEAKSGEGRRSRPSSKPSTPKRPKWVAHDDTDLRLGAGYDAPPDARSVQKDTIDMDNKRIKLGVKYQTQGRNE